MIFSKTYKSSDFDERQTLKVEEIKADETDKPALTCGTCIFNCYGVCQNRASDHHAKSIPDKACEYHVEDVDNTIHIDNDDIKERGQG